MTARTDESGGDEVTNHLQGPIRSRTGISRRELLKALGIGVPGLAVVAGCVPDVDPDFPPPNHVDPDVAPFTDGVIAGDPRPDGTTIWTRLEPVDRFAQAAPIGVVWMVASDPDMASVVAGGTTEADASHDFAVHVDVSGLAADRWYWYRFEAEGSASRIGRLRTAPAAGTTPDRLRFAFASCQQLNDSWFVAHRAAADEPDLDFFMHLGDYVYVNDQHTQSTDDYRGVYRRWRSEPLLRDFHAQVPMVAMWDDGEFYNGIDRFGPPQRLEAAKRAWFDHMPLIDPGGLRTYRSLGWGSLMDLAVIDTRSYRDPAIASSDRTSGPGLAAYDPTRTTLGAEQYAWLVDQLVGSEASWRVVGNGVPISPWRLINLEFLRPFRPDLPPQPGVIAATDGWDDYVRERRDLLEELQRRGVDNTVFATGQTHIAFSNELRPDPDDGGGPAAAFEFVSPAMTADPDVRRTYLGDLPNDVANGALHLAETFLLGQNPGMRHMDLQHQGYVLVDATPDELVVEYRNIDTYDPDAEPVTGAKFRLAAGARHIEILTPQRWDGSFAP